jgi:hypothetical protein
VTPGYIYCTAQYLKVSKTIDDVVGHMALNTGVTGYASSEMLAGEDIASGKYVRLYYYNNSWFQGAPLTNSGSIQAGSGATGGMTVGTLANATLAFFTNGVSNTRISITGAGVITLPSPATLTISALSTAGILANSAAGLISSSALGTAGVVPMYSATGLAASVMTQTSNKIRIGDAGSAANLLDVYKSVTGGTALSVRNPTAGTGNYGAIFVGADRDTLGQLAATSTTFTPSAPHTADCFSVKSIGVGGLSLIASYASGGTYGPVTIYAGGTAESARFTNVGLGIGCTPATTLAIGGTNAAISITSYDHPTVSTGNYTPVCSRVEFHSAAPATMTLLAGSLPEGTILICTQDNGSSYVTVNGHSMVNGVGCIFIQTHDAGWNCIGFGKAD